MKIYVLSDTHNSFAFGGFLSKIADADMVIHLGDGMRDKLDLQSAAPCPVYSVRGNCDTSGKDFEVIEAEGHRIFACHGHFFGVKTDSERLISAALEQKCDIALFGHTHIPQTEFYKGVWLINPGSLCRPLGGAKGTYCILTVERDRIYPQMVLFE